MATPNTKEKLISPHGQPLILISFLLHTLPECRQESRQGARNKVPHALGWQPPPRLCRACVAARPSIPPRLSRACVVGTKGARCRPSGGMCAFWRMYMGFRPTLIAARSLGAAASPGAGTKNGTVHWRTISLSSATRLQGFLSQVPPSVGIAQGKGMALNDRPTPRVEGWVKPGACQNKRMQLQSATLVRCEAFCTSLDISTHKPQ